MKGSKQYSLVAEAYSFTAAIIINLNLDLN